MNLHFIEGAAAAGVELSALEEAFRRFAVHGDARASGREMHGKNWSKLCRDCQVIDGRSVTVTDVDIVFSKIKCVPAPPGAVEGGAGSLRAGPEPHLWGSWVGPGALVRPEGLAWLSPACGGPSRGSAGSLGRGQGLWLGEGLRRVSPACGAGGGGSRKQASVARLLSSGGVHVWGRAAVMNSGRCMRVHVCPHA